jgi:hypothetical protein
MASASAPTQARDNQVHRDEEARYAELVPNLDRKTPPTAAAFGMMMLATPKGDACTFVEQAHFKKMPASRGLSLAPPEIGLDRLVVAYR